jgi:hypothetical protein
MKKKLIEYFIGNLITSTVIILITNRTNHIGITLRTVLIDILIIVIASTLMSLAQYFLFRTKE